jgi:DNA-binding PadR family transcriptional regulator
LTADLYICRVITVTRDRKCSNQTLALLAALTEQHRIWRHGYDLAAQTGLKSGTLYPILMRLGDRGLLDSKWMPHEPTGRPPRHMYRLTTRGIAFAREQLATSPAAIVAAAAQRKPA